MYKIATIVGARPQFIKAAALNRVIRRKYSDSIREILIHTGQHYDYGMSAIFFREMDIPRPDYSLNIGSGTHGIQTGEMLRNIEKVLMKIKPDLVLVYGDTNSTLAGALAAAKLDIPLAHVEAGLRSYNKTMPEEINRIVSDHAATLLFCPTRQSVLNLRKENIFVRNNGAISNNNPLVVRTGDVMFDNFSYFSKQLKDYFVNRLRLEKNSFFLVTLHRPAATDNIRNLSALIQTFTRLTDEGYMIVFPVHPRTRKTLQSKHLIRFLTRKMENKIRLLSPVSYLEMLSLEKNCSIILTDSGGVQKEAYFFKKPCITLRTETEWIELVKNGNNIVTGYDEKKIIRAVKYFEKISSHLSWRPLYGNGKTSENILRIMYKFMNNK